MNTASIRRPRGTVKDMRAVHLKISGTQKEKLELVAKTLQKTQSEVLDMWMAELMVDDDGRPSFWSGPLPDARPQLELPLTG